MTLERIKVEKFSIDEATLENIVKAKREAPIQILRRELGELSFNESVNLPENLLGGKRYYSYLNLEFPKTGIRIHVKEDYMKQPTGEELTNANATLSYCDSDSNDIPYIKRVLAQAGFIK